MASVQPKALEGRRSSLARDDPGQCGDSHIIRPKGLSGPRRLALRCRPSSPALWLRHPTWAVGAAHALRLLHKARQAACLRCLSGAHPEPRLSQELPVKEPTNGVPLHRHLGDPTCLPSPGSPLRSQAGPASPSSVGSPSPQPREPPDGFPFEGTPLPEEVAYVPVGQFSWRERCFSGRHRCL